MPASNEIWLRLQSLEFDEAGASFTFTDRLARDNGWTHVFARRAIEEYRRFAYLAVAAGHEVTPSDEIDQVWHLHLTYTRHYWGPFVAALGAPLHHGPTKGGASERKKYLQQYEETLSSYKKIFGEMPPVDIWPDATIRFREPIFMRRINNRKNIVINKRLMFGALAGLAGALALGASVSAQNGGIADKVSEFAGNSWVPYLVIGFVILILIANIASRVRGKSNRDGGCSAGYGDSGCGDSGCGGCGGD